jgi:hypothetical protein
MRLVRFLAVFLLVALGASNAAKAQGVQLYCYTRTTPTGGLTWAPASAANPCPMTGSGPGGATTTTPTVSTFQGTMTLTAATSTTLTSGNVTMASSTVLPSTFQNLFVLNTGTNPVFVCWFGGTASATSGCETIVAGASDTRNLGNFATPPTLFSTAGTTLAFGN